MSIFNELDELFSLFDGDYEAAPTTRYSYSVPSFPPCNVILEDNGNLKFVFALAGYSKKDLGIDYKDNKLKLYTISKYEIPVIEGKLLANGFKRPSFNYSYFVPETKFNIEELKAVFENGVLEITIPAKEEKKKNTTFTIC